MRMFCIKQITYICGAAKQANCLRVLKKVSRKKKRCWIVDKGVCVWYRPDDDKGDNMDMHCIALDVI